MTLSIGQLLKGRAASYQITKVLKSPTVFQAKILPFENSQASPQANLAILKHCPPHLSRTQYNRDLYNYTIDSIARSPHVRSLIDLIGHDNPSSSSSATPELKCMVFEWMDTDLWQLPSKPFRAGSELPRVVARSVLEALAVFDSEGGVHTDVNPNNVFVSGASGPAPIVKLGDLGNLMAAGPMLGTQYQGVVIRAPEVWIDIPITPKVDVWSLGVTNAPTKMAHWLACKTIFGPADKIVEDFTEHWCIAKLMRLVGPLENPSPSKTEIVDEFALAAYFAGGEFVSPENGRDERFIKVGSIREELEKVEGPIEKGCVEFVESLLVVDPGRRPSAREALSHSWLVDGAC